MRFVLFLLLTTLSTGYAQVAAADPLDDAAVAYDRKDYATALRIIRPLADKGDARAQYDLGVIYAEGKAEIGRAHV